MVDSPVERRSTIHNSGPKISEEFVFKIIDLEQKCKKTNSQQYILELVRCYTKVIEYYNSKQDNMSIYFSQKMQILLSNQKTIDIIDKTQQQLTASMAAGDAMQGAHLIKDRSSYDVQSKKKQRSKMVKMFIQIKKTKKRGNAAQILNQYYKQSVQNNSLVHVELARQNNDLQQRLKQIFNNSKNTKKLSDNIFKNNDVEPSIYIS